MFVHITLWFLGKGTESMPDKLMGERPGNILDSEGGIGVLQHRVMAALDQHPDELLLTARTLFMHGLISRSAGPLNQFLCIGRDCQQRNLHKTILSLIYSTSGILPLSVFIPKLKFLAELPAFSGIRLQMEFIAGIP